jgi:hypothetical protein
MIRRPASGRRKETIAMGQCPNVKKNSVDCTCTYRSCSKHGVCCECVAYHRANGEVPGCLFPAEAERTYDRSVRKYVEVMR